MSGLNFNSVLRTKGRPHCRCNLPESRNLVCSGRKNQRIVDSCRRFRIAVTLELETEIVETGSRIAIDLHIILRREDPTYLTSLLIPSITPGNR